MKLNEFQELSKRTMPYNGVPANQTEFENMLGNYAMGLVGEWFEFSCAAHLQKGEATVKEAGDVLHYAVGLLACLNEKVDYELLVDIEIGDVELAEALGDILEIPKKFIYHRHELQRETLLKATHTVLKIFVETFNREELSEILKTNIDKLKTRYPEKFNTADSINRVDVAANK